MADPQQEETVTENVGLGALGGGAVGEVIFDVTLSPKTKESGDGDDVSSAAETSINENSMMKSELDDSISSAKSNSRNKSASPTPKRLSKRKRKNRRRREKRAVAESTNAGVGGPQSQSSGGGADDGTGTETEYSQEDTKKGEETGTESETTWVEADQKEPSLQACASIRGGTALKTLSPHDSKERITVKDRDNAKQVSENATGPAQSVDTLLQIAKCKILSHMLEPMHESEDEASKKKLKDFQDDNSPKLMVPPCSPSSRHRINNTTASVETNEPGPVKIVEGAHKAVPKIVHFDEGPPEIVPIEEIPSEEVIFSVQLDNVSNAKERQENAEPLTCSKKASSKEDIALIGNVGHINSTTSSIASETSAASLLKGNGSSSEDFTESSFHYPSRESVDESQSLGKQSQQHEACDINTDAFKETIQIFKVQNPVEAQYIGNQVDSILTKSVDKFTTLMGKTADSDNSSILMFVRGENAPHDVKAKDTLDLRVKGQEKTSEHETEADKKASSEDLDVSLNTTFTVEKFTVESENTSTFSLRPMSPIDIMPQAIPDTVSDSESIATVGNLSIVPEEDETSSENDLVCVVVESASKVNVMSPSQTASASSFCTVIEIENVPSVNETASGSLMSMQLSATSHETPAAHELITEKQPNNASAIQTSAPPETTMSMQSNDGPEVTSVNEKLSRTETTIKTVSSNEALEASSTQEKTAPVEIETITAEKSDNEEKSYRDARIPSQITMPKQSNNVPEAASVQQKSTSPETVTAKQSDNSAKIVSVLKKKEKPVSPETITDTESNEEPESETESAKHKVSSSESTTAKEPNEASIVATGTSFPIEEAKSAEKSKNASVIRQALLQQEKVTDNAFSSASSTKSSVSSPRLQDMNENDKTASDNASRPSTGGATGESGQDESECETEEKKGTEAKQSVEVFTLHLTSMTDAPPSENNLNSGNGDQPHFGRNNLAGLLSSVPGSVGKNVTVSSPPHGRNDGIAAAAASKDTETDSDYQWLPERKNSLLQVIHEKEASEDAASTKAHACRDVAAERNTPKRNGPLAEKRPKNNSEDLDADKEDEDQGCNCAKMCVIT